MKTNLTEDHGDNALVIAGRKALGGTLASSVAHDSLLGKASLFSGAAATKSTAEAAAEAAEETTKSTSTSTSTGVGAGALGLVTTTDKVTKEARADAELALVLLATSLQSADIIFLTNGPRGTVVGGRATLGGGAHEGRDNLSRIDSAVSLSLAKSTTLSTTEIAVADDGSVSLGAARVLGTVAGGAVGD